MRAPSRVLSLSIAFILTLAVTTSAQPVSGPIVQSVTLNAETSVITITGSGLSPDVVVTVDGQAVPVLLGGTETRVEIQAPAAVLTTPGTYRLTVVDPV